jgi:riboflavin-specific deaminase-like protein
MSCDGKISTSTRARVQLGSAADRRLLERLRGDADAAIIGAGTLRFEDPALVLRDPALAEARLSRTGARHPVNVVVCTALDFTAESLAFFHEAGVRRLVYTTRRAPAPALERTARYAEVVCVGTDSNGRVALPEVMTDLVGRGAGHVLLEGGGALNFSMFNDDLVDECWLTICPLIVGGRASPTVADGRGFGEDAFRRATLIEHSVSAAGELMCRYRIAGGRGVAERLDPPAAGVV